VTFTRRHVQIALGVLWILDGVLQLQPFMFGPGFAREILAPAGIGQPSWIAGPVAFASTHVAAHPVLANTAFALAQLGLGLGFLLPRTVRPAIVASVIWSLGVWWLGEGLGGLAGGHATLITGGPGAVTLYAALAVAAWQPRHRIAAARPPLGWLTWSWVVIWVGGAVLQLLPGQNRPGDIASQAADLADGAPGWLASLDRAVVQAASATGEPLVLILAAAMAVIGLGALARGALRTAALVAGGVLAGVFWLVGQNLGELYTGQATDPNTGPLLILFSLALLGTAPLVVRPSAPDQGDIMTRHARTRVALPAAALSAVLITTACSGSSSPASSSSPAAPTTSAVAAGPAGSTSRAAAHSAVDITIKSFAFSVSGPASAGSTVKVTNNDSTAHTVTADNGGGFDVTVQPGKTATFTAPAKAGSYKFHCSFHSNMHGTLAVTG
jgi:plastocyanin